MRSAKEDQLKGLPIGRMIWQRWPEPEFKHHLAWRISGFRAIAHPCTNWEACMDDLQDHNFCMLSTKHTYLCYIRRSRTSDPGSGCRGAGTPPRGRSQTDDVVGTQSSFSGPAGGIIGTVRSAGVARGRGRECNTNAYANTSRNSFTQGDWRKLEVQWSHSQHPGVQGVCWWVLQLRLSLILSARPC